MKTCLGALCFCFCQVWLAVLDTQGAGEGFLSNMLELCCDKLYIIFFDVRTLR